MKKWCRKFTSAFKAKFAIEAIKKDKTIHRAGSEVTKVRPSEITT